MPRAESRRFGREAEREAPRLPSYPDAYYGRVRERKAARLAAVRAQAELPLDGDEFFVWSQEQPGHPLGSGMPMGAPLRLDGESHSNAWRRILRSDVCAYCGERVAGTVDHIVPRSSGRAGVERWPNLIGACMVCNTRKASKPLLLFLLDARQTARQVALIKANRPDRSELEAQAIADAQRRKAKQRKKARYTWSPAMTTTKRARRVA